jgi:cytochrome b561
MFEEAHELLAWTLALLVAAHVAAALYHWLWRKDDVMQRMLR